MCREAEAVIDRSRGGNRREREPEREGKGQCAICWRQWGSRRLKICSFVTVGILCSASRCWLKMTWSELSTCDAQRMRERIRARTRERVCCVCMPLHATRLFNICVPVRMRIRLHRDLARIILTHGTRAVSVQNELTHAIYT